MDKKEEVKEIRYPTGCDLLDMVVGGDKDKFGWQGGMIINIVGDKSSGKSFLAYETIAAAKYKYKDDFKWVYDNCESSSIVNSMRLYGFEIMTDDMPKSRTVEEMSTNVRKFLRNLKPEDKAIYVVDSLDGLSSAELDEIVDERQKAFEKGKEYDKGSYQMSSAKFLSQEFFRTLANDIDNKNCLLIIISQLRENVNAGLYAPKFKRSGGKALDFYANTVLWLNTLDKIEKKDRAIGVIINGETKKSKTPRPYRDVTFSILFDYGIDNVGSNLDFLYDLRGKRGDLLKNAKEIDWDGQTFNRDDLIAYIETNKLKNELRARTRQKWEDIEDSIKVNRQSKYGDE